MKTKIIFILMFILMSINISAQSLSRNTSNDSSINVIELNAFLSTSSTTQRATSQSDPNILNIENVRDLTNNTQPSIYYFEGNLKIYGEKPKNLFTDINSLEQLEAVTLKNNIEIVIIKIDNGNQLNRTIDLALLSNFKNLKYIYIISNVVTTSDNIASMITNYNEKYSVFYKINRGDSNQ